MKRKSKFPAAVMVQLVTKALTVFRLVGLTDETASALIADAKEYVIPREARIEYRLSFFGPYAGLVHQTLKIGTPREVMFTTTRRTA